MNTIERVRLADALRREQREKRSHTVPYRANPHCDACRTVERLKSELAKAQAELREYKRQEQEELDALDRWADAREGGLLSAQGHRSKARRYCMECKRAHYVQPGRGWYCMRYCEFTDEYCEVDCEKSEPA